MIDAAKRTIPKRFFKNWKASDRAGPAFPIAREQLTRCDEASRCKNVEVEEGVEFSKFSDL